MLRQQTWWKLLCVLCAAAVVLTSCSQKKAEKPKVDMNEPFVLHIGAADLLRFLENYQEILAERFPMMEIEVSQIKDFVLGGLKPGETFEQAQERQTREDLSKNEWDLVIYTNEYFHRNLIDSGFIEPLDVFIKRDEYDMGPMYQPVLERLRAYGDGQLYGIPPFFSPGYITYFNQELFDRMGVAVPEPPYTWNQLIELGGRFAGQMDDDKPVSGFAVGCGEASTTGQLVMEIGRSAKLALFNDKFEMTFQGDGWAKALEPLSQAIMNGSYKVPAAGAGEDCAKTMKYSAIIFASADKAGTLKQLTPAEQPINYQLDVAPSSDNGLLFGNAAPQEIVSIVKGSPVADQAWEVLKALNEESLVKKFAAIESVNPMLPMRQEVPYQHNGLSYEQFYVQKDDTREVKLPEQRVMTGYWRIFEMITQEFGVMQNEGRSLEETMAAVQQKGNEILTAYKKEGL